MGVADIAGQLAMRQKEDNQRAMDEMVQMVKMERVKRLGRKLMEGGDFSPEGLMRFAQSEGVQIDEMQPLVQLVGQFQKMQAKEAGPNRFAESERGILNQQTGEFSPHAPGQVSPSSPFAKLLRDKDLYPQGTPERDAIEKQIAKQNEPSSSGAPSTLGKLIEEMGSLPEGDPRRELYQKRIAKEASQTGMKISVGTDGEVTVLTNADQDAPGSALTKPVATQVQKDVLDLNRTLLDLNEIYSSFKPEFMQVDTRLRATKTEWGEKLGFDMPEEDIKQMNDLAAFKQSSFRAINERINKLTGTAMSKIEADRIMQELPKPGTGIWDGDSASNYKRKLDGSVSHLKKIIARANYANRNGLKPLDSGISFDGKDKGLPTIDSIIDKRGSEIESDMRKKFPGEAENVISKKVKEQLKQEFGMVF